MFYVIVIVVIVFKKESHRCISVFVCFTITTIFTINFCQNEIESFVENTTPGYWKTIEKKE